MYSKLIVKLDSSDSLPHRAHPTDAGADLRASADEKIFPGEMKVVSTGVAVKIPEGFVGFIFSRSGMGKVRVTLANSVGVIDAHYRGELKCMVENNGADIFNIKRGDRVAQLVLVPIITPEFITYNEEIHGEWDDTVRGSKGFGSTGT